MDRKWKSGAAGSPPALDNASDGYATAGDPGSGTPATKPGPHWYHMVTEELRSAIVAAGLTPDKTNVGQLAQAIPLLASAASLSAPGGRLTLTTAVPVTTADVTAATTVYYTPHQSDRVQLYNGTFWAAVQFTELSQATTDNTKSPAAAANNSNYDMFVWSDGGTIRCTRGPAWSSGTARGTGAGTTELELFEGRLVNKVAITNGPAARRGVYVGSVGTNGSAQVNDALNLRMVWNCYNRRIRPLRRVESTDTWTQAAGAAYRQGNNSASNQIDVLTGLNDEIVNCVLAAHSVYIGGTGGTAIVAIGLDSTTAQAPGSLTSRNSRANPSAINAECHFASFSDFVGLGRHSLVWLEFSGSQTASWSGDDGSAIQQSGLNGSMNA